MTAIPHSGKIGSMRIYDCRAFGQHVSRVRGGSTRKIYDQDAVRSSFVFDYLGFFTPIMLKSQTAKIWRKNVTYCIPLFRLARGSLPLNFSTRFDKMPVRI